MGRGKRLSTSLSISVIDRARRKSTQNQSSTISLNQSFTDQEIKAANKYVNKDQAGEINFALRTGENFNKWESTVSALRSGISKGKLTSPCVLYRGIEDYGNIYSLLEEGEQFSEQSFLSTSTNPLVASNFLGTHGSKNVILKIEASAGTRGLEPSLVLPRLEFGEAGEIILDTNVDLQVVSKTRKPYELFDGSSVEALEIVAKII